MDILHEIAERTKARIEARKIALPQDKLEEMAYAAMVAGDDGKAICVEGKTLYTDSKTICADGKAISAGGKAINADSKAICADSTMLYADGKTLCFDAGEMPRHHFNAGDFPFEKALRSDDIAIICEVKKASPSKGVIAVDYQYIDIALEYEAAGAAAISVLTEPFYFQGEDRHLREIADKVATPLLRKDFTIDSYMIYEAKLLGAAAILLICALMDEKMLTGYIGVAHSLGLSALVEAHDREELKMALDAGARIVGVNNRDLRTFEVDINNSMRLRKLAPADIVFVSESGIRTAEDIDALRQCGVDAVLIGETFMRSPDKKAALAALRNKP